MTNVHFTVTLSNSGLHAVCVFHTILAINRSYEGWNFNSGNYLFTTDTK